MTPLLAALWVASVGSSLVAVAVAIALLLTRTASSALRHQAWRAVLYAMLAMPILQHLTPHLDLPVAVQLGSGLGDPPSDLRPIRMEVSSESTLEKGAANEPHSEPVGSNLPSWPTIAVWVYGVGVTAFLCRFLMGWLYSRRVVRASSRISLLEGLVYESQLVSTPVTIGLTVRRIFLPRGWSEWPEPKLRAVMAHERAHVERYDNITNFAAHFNRCLFWFHPLSWWLQRQLALTAEQVCDEAGVRALGENRRYAELLLEMALTVRRRGNRLACHGVGVGAGLLARRIDHILRGDPVQTASRPQKALVALSCAAAVLVSAACQERSIYSVELKPDPHYATTLAKLRADEGATQAVREIDGRQANDLEAAVRRHPNDLLTRKKLVAYYETSGRKAMGSQNAASASVPHRLWCIEHHPNDVCATNGALLLSSSAYREVKKLWLAVTQRKDVEPAVLMSAAGFFEVIEPRLAESLALRVPVANVHRAALLARIYTGVLAGPPPQAPYADEVRKKLENSKDSSLLTGTGFNLSVLRGKRTDHSTTALGRSYLERAVALDPSSTEARTALTRTQRYDSNKQLDQRIVEEVGAEPTEGQYQKASALPDRDRFKFFPRLAEIAYIRGDMLGYYQRDRTEARRAWELAKRYALDTLRVAPEFKSEASYRDGLYRANMTLGMVAMRVDGNIRVAREYLLAASTLRTTDDGAPFTFKLPATLLKYGGPVERKAVIDFLEQCAKTSHCNDADLLLAAQQLREGNMPIWYQSFVQHLE